MRQGSKNKATLTGKERRADGLDITDLRSFERKEGRLTRERKILHSFLVLFIIIIQSLVVFDVVAESTKSELPARWKEWKTSDGKIYYQKPDGTTTWTKPVNSDETPLESLSTSKEKNVFKKAAEPPDGYALIYFYRLKVPPYLIRAKLLIDDKKIVKIPNYGYSWFYLKEGVHNLQTKWGVFSGAPSLEAAFRVDKGKTYFLRLLGDIDIRVFSVITSSQVSIMKEDLALKELELVRKFISAKNQKIE